MIRLAGQSWHQGHASGEHFQRVVALQPTRGACTGLTCNYAEEFDHVTAVRLGLDVVQRA